MTTSEGQPESGHDGQAANGYGDRSDPDASGPHPVWAGRPVSDQVPHEVDWEPETPDASAPASPGERDRV